MAQSKELFYLMQKSTLLVSLFKPNLFKSQVVAYIPYFVCTFVTQKNVTFMKSLNFWLSHHKHLNSKNFLLVST